MLPENLSKLTGRRLDIIKARKRKIAAELAGSKLAVVKVKGPKPGPKISNDSSLAKLSKFVDNEKLAVQIIEIGIETVEQLKESTREDLKGIKSPMYKGKLYKLLSI